MTPEDATTRIAEGMGQLATSLDRLTRVLQRGVRALPWLIVLVGLALCGVGALAWQGYELHQQTRVLIDRNLVALTGFLSL